MYNRMPLFSKWNAKKGGTNMFGKVTTYIFQCDNCKKEWRWTENEVNDISALRHILEEEGHIIGGRGQSIRKPYSDICSDCITLVMKDGCGMGVFRPTLKDCFDGCPLSLECEKGQRIMATASLLSVLDK
jgi:hypothetical protein